MRTHQTGVLSLGRWLRRGLAPALATLTLLGCGIDSAERNESDVLLLVTEVSTTAGGGGDQSAFLLSDVVRVDDPAGFFNDNATLTVENVPKNPTVTTQSNYSDVIMERYTVRFFRSDGHNTEGVDVPYTFQGPLAGTVPAGSESEVALILVRHQAKREPPLNQLQQGGGANILSCFAEVTIFGRTLAGKVVTTQATIGITFADFGD